MGFVLLIAQRVRQMPLLVVSGVMIGYICSAVTDFVITFAEDSNIVNLHNWSMGSFSGISWDNIRVMTPGGAGVARVRVPAVQTDRCVPARRGVCPQYGRQYRRVPRGADPAVERALGV